MDRTSTYGLNIEQLADLFSIAVEEHETLNDISDDQAIAERLHEQLASPLPKHSFLLDSVLMMMGRLGCDLRELAGKSLGEVLLDPETDIGLLQAIKDHSKSLSCAAVSESDSATATTIYYAALAGSLLYHDKRISQYSYETLDKSFGVLMEKEWMMPELVRLFSRAQKVCQEKRQGK